MSWCTATAGADPNIPGISCKRGTLNLKFNAAIQDNSLYFLPLSKLGRLGREGVVDNQVIRYLAESGIVIQQFSLQGFAIRTLVECCRDICPCVLVQTPDSRYRLVYLLQGLVRVDLRNNDRP
jgi:hypothetical protein